MDVVDFGENVVHEAFGQCESASPPRAASASASTRSFTGRTCRSSAPGATATSRGLRVRFAGTSLRERFHDQTAPCHYFGCDLRRRFEGTLFRFPFRSETTEIGRAHV